MTSRVAPSVTIFTDGSTAPSNPGLGGYAAILTSGNRTRAIYGGIHFCTNNYAEAYAVVKGLEVLTKPCRVYIYTDSMYVINGMRRVQKCISRNYDEDLLLGTNRDVWLTMLPLVARHDVYTTHVDGHSVHEHNELADSLAEWGSKHGLSGSFYLHEVEEGTAEVQLLKTVQKRVDTRKRRQEVLKAQRRMAHA